MDKLSAAQIGGIVRALMGAAGGVLIAVGWVDETSWLEISGAIVTLATVGWSLYSNTIVQQAKTVAKSPEVKAVVASPEMVYAANSPKVVPTVEYVGRTQ